MNWTRLFQCGNSVTGDESLPLVCPLHGDACPAKEGPHEASHLQVESPKFDDKPHIWIQWKGTDVCCDIRCVCGENAHFDGDFLYFFQCRSCNRYWEVGTHVEIYEVREDRAGDFCKTI